MDIVEQGRLYIQAEEPQHYRKTVVWKMADEIERLREANDKMVRALNAISCQDADCKDDGVVWCAKRARAALEGKE